MMDALKKAIKDKQNDNFAIIVAKLDGGEIQELKDAKDMAPMAKEHKAMMGEEGPEMAMQKSEGMPGEENKMEMEVEGKPDDIKSMVKGQLMGNNEKSGLAAKIKELLQSKMKKV